MRERGHEYGTTTGRQRRCGWIDLVALRYAARINGLTGLVVTKLDVLSGLDRAAASAPATATPRAPCSRSSPTTSRSCTAPSRSTRSCPASRRTSASAARSADLPQTARDYLAFIADFVGVPIRLVSVGPGREQVMWMEEAAARATRRRPRGRQGLTR